MKRSLTNPEEVTGKVLAEQSLCQFTYPSTASPHIRSSFSELFEQTGTNTISAPETRPVAVGDAGAPRLARGRHGAAGNLSAEPSVLARLGAGEGGAMVSKRRLGSESPFGGDREFQVKVGGRLWGLGLGSGVGLAPWGFIIHTRP